ncbi:MAG TPA: LTA synthase family protein, partial [Acholeplasmataceae bacterium]|nr:LTA synthase family protein [Acholeplasmataceae bacterium]
LFITFPIYKLDKNIEGTIYENSVNGIYGAHVAGVYNYYVYDFYDHYLKKESTDQTDIEKINEYLKFYEEKEYVNPIDNKTYSVINEFTGIAEGKNLLIIQLEAFNNFLINLKVDGVEITPNLNKLANNSLYYNRFYSSSGIGNTSDCEFSALTGLYGNGNDLTIFSASGKNYNTLAKDFSKNNYHTFSFHGNVGDFYHRNSEHIHTLGFDEFYPLEYFQENGDAPLIHGYLDDKYFFKELPKILESKSKFFGYAISVTSHSPYVPTEEIPQHNFNNLTTLSSSYLDFCHYVDEGIGILISEMEERNILDDTVIVLYGDHTSSLFKHDVEGILDKKLSEVDFRMIMQNVPFIIYNEDLFPPQVNNKIGSTIDVYRTMANLFGLDQKYHFGNDLLSNEPNMVYSPRTLDIILDDSIIFYPTGEVFGKNNNSKKYIDLFNDYKYHNDLILKTKYFK